MLYYILVSLIFLSQLSVPISQGSLSSLEPYLTQDENLKLRINTETKYSSSKITVPRKISDSIGIHTTAQSAIVIDKESGKVLFQKEPEKQLPIASITKLMTALVFLEHNPGFDQVGQMGAGENSLAGARLYVKSGDEVRVADLFYSSLVGSANNATQALVHTTGLSGEEFVAKMNKKAQILGMKNTKFKEPTGLSKDNVSTVQDLAKLAQVAFSAPLIQEATTLKEYSLTTIAFNELHRIKSQNELLTSFLTLTGAKTGFTNEAGYCLIVQAKNEAGNEVIAAVLGSATNDTRFTEIKGLVAWAFENYQWL